MPKSEYNCADDIKNGNKFATKLQKNDIFMTEELSDGITRPDLPVWVAVAHIAAVIGDCDLHRCYLEARRQFRHAALQGKFEVWGYKATRLTPNGLNSILSETLSRIDPLYWQNWGLNERSAKEFREDDAHTEADAPVTVGLTTERYWGLRVYRNEVSRMWWVT